MKSSILRCRNSLNQDNLVTIVKLVVYNFSCKFALLLRLTALIFLLIQADKMLEEIKDLSETASTLQGK